MRMVECIYMATKKKHKAVSRHHSSVRTAPRRERTGVRYIYYGIGIAVFALLASSQFTYTQDFRGAVLGDDSSRNQQEDQKSQQEQQQEQQKQQEQEHQQEQQGGKQDTSEVNVQKNELEVQNENGTKLKVKVEDNGIQKVEGEGEKFHFKFSGSDGNLKLEAVNERGEKLATGEAEARRLEKELSDKEIKVSSQDGSMEMERNGFKVRTNFPLSINPSTGQLTVTTPAGIKTVAVLPDDAIQNMLNQGLFTTVTAASGSATASGSGFLTNSFAMTLRNGEPVYQISGEKQGKLFGLIPVTLPRIVYVSAETGQAVALSQSWLSQIMSLLSR